MTKKKTKIIIISALCAFVLLAILFAFLPRVFAHFNWFDNKSVFYNWKLSGENQILGLKNNSEERIAYLHELSERRIKDIEKNIPYTQEADNRAQKLITDLQLTDLYTLELKDSGSDGNYSGIEKILQDFNDYYQRIEKAAKNKDLEENVLNNIIDQSFVHFRKLAVLDQFLTPEQDAINQSISKTSQNVVNILNFHKGGLIVDSYREHIYTLRMYQDLARYAQDGEIGTIGIADHDF